MEEKQIKSNIIQAGYKAINELIKIAEEKIIIDSGVESVADEALAADKLKNAAATKKLAIFDAFEILTRIEEEKAILEDRPIEEKDKIAGFAERRSK